MWRGTFTWQQLRQTCSTYSVNAKSIFGDAPLFLACAAWVTTPLSP